MLSENEFDVLLERYEDDPAVCSKLIRTYALAEPGTFVRYAQAAIMQRQSSRAVKFITGLAISAGIIPVLLETYSRNRFEALNLAKKITQAEPRFDLTLAEHVIKPASSSSAEETLINSVLDILDTISEGDLLVPTVLKLLKHPNPKVRSKAALFVGSRTQNMAWAASRSQEYDPRVRANILESLYGLNSDFVIQMFRTHTADENNRVAGNAVLGLYLLGEAASIPLICNLAKHPDARFRNTAAWVMGRTGDPRFAPVFSELLNDPDELVRSQSFKGLREMKKAVRAASTRPIIAVTLRRLQMQGALSNVTATLLDGAGQPLRGVPPTAFLLKAGTPPRFVRDFSVEEYDCRSSLNIGFILCLPVENEAAVAHRFMHAVEECAPLRRSKDRWTILKISGSTLRRVPSDVSGALGRYWQKWAMLNVTEGDEVGPGVPDIKLEYTTHQHRISAMLAEPVIRISDDRVNDSRSLMTLLTHVDMACGKPHLVFVASGKPRLIEELEQSRAEINAVVHLVSESKEWDTPVVREAIDRTGGSVTFCEPEEIADACKNLNHSLLHHYKIASAELADPLELEVHSTQGEGSTIKPIAVPGSEQRIAV